MTSVDFPPDSVDTLIARQLPDWLTHAPADRRSTFLKALRKQEQTTRNLGEVLHKIPSLEAFARQLLTAGLQQAGVSNEQAWRWQVFQQESEFQPSVQPGIR